MKKHRFLILAILILGVEITIAIFLKSGFIKHTFGDYLAAIFVYCILAYFLKLTPQKLFIASLLICYGIEFLQLFKILHFLNLQHHKIINLIFGNHFSISDLVAYTLGVLSIAIIHKKITS